MKDKRFALLIGINYTGQSCALEGCINDVKDMAQLLKTKFNYKDCNMTIMTDESNRPTKDNILKCITELVIGTVKGDVESIFLHYSGHGSYIVDHDGDENDGYDEVICPLDFNNKGVITDDQLNSKFKLMSKSANVVALFDCCHSGSMLDLKYNHIYADKRVDEERNAPHLESHIVAISGCRDNQTSADAYISGRFNGAMTRAFIESLKNKNYSITYFDLLKDMRMYLKKNKYPQVPQMTTSLKLDDDDYFCKPRTRTLFLSF